MMKTHRLVAALGLMLGTCAFGALQAAQPDRQAPPETPAGQTDEMTEDTLPFPEGSLQGAPDASPPVVQDAASDDDDRVDTDALASRSDDLMTDDFGSETADDDATGTPAAKQASSSLASGDDDE